MSENLSIPRPFAEVDRDVMERLSEQYRGQTVDAVQFPGFFDTVPSGNDAVLDAIGSFKDQVIEYAEDTHKRKIRKIDYVVDARDAEPGKQQRVTPWHTERVRNGISILTSSVLPTTFLVQSDETTDAEPYLERTPIESIGSIVYGAATIKRGKDAGVLEEHRPVPYDIVELDGRIHRADFNMTGEIARRVFLACEVVFKKEPTPFRKFFS